MIEIQCDGKTSRILATLRSLYIGERAVKMAEFPCNEKNPIGFWPPLED